MLSKVKVAKSAPKYRDVVELLFMNFCLSETK